MDVFIKQVRVIFEQSGCAHEIIFGSCEKRMSFKNPENSWYNNLRFFEEKVLVSNGRFGGALHRVTG